MKHTIFVALGLALVAQAPASFELVLVADSFTNSVHRFDGITGTYFQSFGGGLMNGVRSMAINQNLNTAYVLEDNGTTVSSWNYNTGEYLSTLRLGGSVNQIGSFLDGSIAVVTPTLITRLNSAGATLGAWAPPTDYSWVAVSGNDSFGQYSFLSYSATSDTSRIYAPTSSSTISGSSYFISGGGSPRTCVSSAGRYLLTGFDNSFAGAQNKTNGGAAFGFGQVANIRACGSGHDSMTYWTGKDPGNPAVGMVGRMDGTTGKFRGTFGSQALIAPVGMGVVVAPEPGTLLAVGAGFALWVRRRSCR